MTSDEALALQAIRDLLARASGLAMRCAASAQTGTTMSHFARIKAATDNAVWKCDVQPYDDVARPVGNVSEARGIVVVPFPRR